VATLLAADLQATLAFVRKAEAVTGPDPFPTELLDNLRELVPSDMVGYDEQDRSRGHSVYYGGCSRAREIDAAATLPVERIFWLLMHQSPIVLHHERTGDFSPIKLSDYLTGRQLHRLEIHRDFFRPCGIEYRLVVGLPAPRSHTKCFLFDRGAGRRDYEERDRLVLDLLLPHLAACYAAARDRRLAAALTVGEAASGALVVLAPSGRVDFADPAAGELIARYFEGASPGRLPEQIQDWLGYRSRRFDGNGSLPAPDVPLTVARIGSRLVVRRIGHVLLLREEDALLTAREREIVELLAEGMSNGEIAIALTLAPTTVRKHLENIYAKLGVHTRTAAVARVRQR
jgi:DNA-binding CsgD family transcriptional regulator